MSQTNCLQLHQFWNGVLFCTSYQGHVKGKPFMLGNTQPKHLALKHFATLSMALDKLTLLLAGVGPQLSLLDQVVACMKEAVLACQLAANWTQHAQQLQHSIDALKAVVGADATSAGRYSLCTVSHCLSVLACCLAPHKALCTKPSMKPFS